MAARSSRVITHRHPHRRAIAFTLAGVVVAAIGLVSLGRLGVFSRVTGACPSAEIVVAVSAKDASTMRTLAANWSATKPRIDGRCAGVTVVEKASSDVASTLGSGWDTQRDGPLPDVWVPDSSLWLSAATSRPDAAAIIPSQTTSIASSPVVLAVRQPLARALGWPSRPLGWADVIGAFNRPDVWGAAGHPDWATLRIGLTDPAVSTEGLASVLSILGSEPGGQVGEEQLMAGLGLTKVVGALAPDTAAFFSAQASSPGAGPNAMVAAFPALERDVAVYNQANTTSPLAPVYNGQGAVIADYPYAVLSGSWVSDIDRAVADQFRQYLLTAPAQAVLGTPACAAPIAPCCRADSCRPSGSGHGRGTTVTPTRRSSVA